MDSPTPTTPPSHRSESRLRSKPTSRLSNLFDEDDPMDHHHPPTLTPPSTKRSPISPSHFHLSIQEILLQSPSTRPRKHRPRPVMEEVLDPTPVGATPRRKGKSRTAAAAAAAAAGLMGCASPRNVRRARRRLEKEIVREDRELVPFEDDVGRVRKRRQSRHKVAHKEKLSLGSAPPSSNPSPRDQEVTDDVGNRSVEGLRELILELIMWNNVAKSALWFGFGSIFFFSSSFSREFSFSIISAISHVGILILSLAFFYDSFPQRQQLKWRGDFQLTEEDIVRAARVVLPMINAVLTKARVIFSGEPSMTLKVAPILLFAARYGHLITLWRLFATGFFLSFTAPKLYSSYSQQIHSRVENMRNYICDTWKSCRHKRFIAASAATFFWNTCSAKTRIVAAFISVVILRYHHQQNIVEEKDRRDSMEEEQQQAMVLAE